MIAYTVKGELNNEQTSSTHAAPSLREVVHGLFKCRATYSLVLRFLISPHKIESRLIVLDLGVDGAKQLLSATNCKRELKRLGAARREERLLRNVCAQANQ